MYKFFTKHERELLNIRDKQNIKKYEIFKIGANAYLNGYDYNRLKEAIKEKNELITDVDIMKYLNCNINFLKKKKVENYIVVAGAIINILNLNIENGVQSKKLEECTAKGLYENEKMKVTDISRLLNISAFVTKTAKKEHGALFDAGLALHRRGVKIELMKIELMKKRELPQKAELLDILKIKSRHSFWNVSEYRNKIDYLLVLAAYLKLLEINLDTFLEDHKCLKKYDLKSEIESKPKFFYR